MERIFTEVQKEQLKSQIDESQKGVDVILDFFGDLCLYLKKLLGGLDLEDYADVPEEYFKQVLDMKDQTKDNIDEIFKKVYKVDDEHKDVFITDSKAIMNIISIVNGLISVITPNGSEFMSGEVLEQIDVTLNDYSSNMKKVSANFDSSLNYIYDNLAADAGLNIIKSLGHIVIGSAIVVGCIYSGNFVGAAKGMYDLANDTIMLGASVTALSTITKSKDSNNVARYNSISRVKNNINTTDLESFIERDDIFNQDSAWCKMANVTVDIMDTASNIYGVYSGGKDIMFGKKNNLSDVEVLVNSYKKAEDAFDIIAAAIDDKLSSEDDNIVKTFFKQTPMGGIITNGIEMGKRAHECFPDLFESDEPLVCKEEYIHERYEIPTMEPSVYLN